MTWREPVTRGSLLLMEGIWTYALVAFLVAAITDGGKPSLLATLAVVFLSFSLSRFLQSSDLSLGVLRIWGTLLSFLLFYAIVRVDFFGDWRFWDFHWADEIFNHTQRTLRDRAPGVVGVPLLWLFWVRGLLRGQQNLGWDNVLGTFGVGVLVVGGVEIFQGSVDAPAAVGRIAVPYVVVGLVAIGLAHAAEADADSGRPFGSTWVLAVGGAVVALAGLALILALFDLGTASHALNVAVNAVWSVMLTVITIVLWPFMKLMEFAFLGVKWFMALITDPQPPRPQPEAQLDECVLGLTQAGLTLQEATARCAGENETKNLPEWIQLLFRILMATGIVGALLLATAFVFTRFRRRERQSAIKESAYQEGRLVADLGGMLNAFLNRLRPRNPFAREHLDAVRRLYFDVIDAAEHRGLTRPPGQTPFEFAPRLDESFAATTPGRITDVFAELRYGGHDPPPDAVRGLREEWESLRRDPQA